MAAGYVFGLYSYQRDLWPLRLIRDAAHLGGLRPLHRGEHGQFARLIAYPGKTEVPCPAPSADTAVMLVMGQSNAANHLSAHFTSQHGNVVVNLFDGKCYGAASPVLGATGEDGEFLTLLGDKLVESGAYKTVVLVPASVGATPIARWRKGGDLNDMVQSVIAGLPSTYKITLIVWVQGEDDALEFTPPEIYARSFASLLETLPPVPMFIAIATRCTGNWQPDNPLAKMQRGLVDNKRVFLGADMDGRLTDADRRADRCHLGLTGQVKVADAFAASIKAWRSGR
jgi:hypothetical protein